MAESRTSLAELTRLLELAGVRNPASWAQSEVEEDIPQLARFMFLRQAWQQVVSEGDTAWIDREIEGGKARPNAPGSGLGIALERLLRQGCSREDISEIVRTTQWQLLHSICYLLSDPSIEESQLQHVGWGLFEVDEAGQIGRPIDGLHESVLETDPTGREMCPKPVV